MKKTSFVLLFVIIAASSAFAFEPWYYSIDKGTVSKKQTSPSDLLAIDLADLEDCEDIQDNVKIRNNTKTKIDKIAIYGTGDFQGRNGYIDNPAFGPNVRGISAIDDVKRLVLLGYAKDIKPGKLRWWSTRHGYNDGILGQFRFIILNVEKPEGLQYKITEIKESFSDLMITIE